MHFIPFNVTFDDSQIDKDLPKKLLEEAEGILAWLVEGCIAWYSQGRLIAPETVKKATKAYQEEMDFISLFLSEKCEDAPGQSVKAGVLYEAYKQWCLDSGERYESNTGFGLRMSEHGYQKKKTKACALYLNIVLKPENDEDPHEDNDEKVVGLPPVVGCGELSDFSREENKQGDFIQKSHHNPPPLTNPPPYDRKKEAAPICTGCSREATNPDEEWNFDGDGLCYCPVCWNLHATAPVLDDATQAETRQSEVVETIAAYTDRLVSGIRVALDLETTGLDRYQHRIVSVQLGIEGEEACILDVRPYYRLPEAEQRVWRHALQTLFATPDITWLGHNLKFDWLFLAQHFGVKPGRSIDTMIVEQVLRNGEKEEKGKYALKNVAARYGLAVSKEEQLATTTLKEGEKLSEQLLAYMAQDVTIPHQVYAAQQALVEEAKVGHVIALEHEALLAVVAMEHHGAMVDRAQLSQIVAIKQQKKTELEAVLLPVLAPAYHQAQTRRASVKAGASQDALWSNLPKRERETFKLSSTPQLQLALAELGVMVEDTRVETLEAVVGRHACIPVLVEWRKVQKLLSTLTSQVVGHIRADGRIHTQFSLAQSGRYTTSTPNIQGLPKQKEGGSDAEDPRRCIVAPSGSLLLQADLSNIELRILAEMSGDATMLRFFAEGKDLHAETARLMFNLAPDANTKKTLVHGVPARMVAKTINFGLAYGMGAQGLAGRVGVSEETAKELMQKYFETYKDVARYLRSSGRAAMERGYAESASGRRRIFPVSGDYWKSRERLGSYLLGMYERSAKNHPIQGTNADILKHALALLYARLPEGAHIVLSIHDEVILECLESQIEEVKDILQRSMMDACREFLKVVRIPDLEINTAPYWKKD